MTSGGDDLDRVDLAGYEVRRWREPQKKRFIAALSRLFALLKAKRDAKLCGMDESIGDALKATPGRTMEMGSAILQERPIQNDLRLAETKQAYTNEELLKAKKKLVEAQTQQVQVDTLAKLLEIYDRLEAQLEGKSIPAIVKHVEGEIERDAIMLSSKLLQQLESGDPAVEESGSEGQTHGE